MLPLLLVACTNLLLDEDHDLLTTADEISVGSDPSNPDHDGDALLDGEEVHFYATDPLDPDSDGDGSDDRWEIDRGLDPLDAASTAYPSGWPTLTLAAKAELLRQPAPDLLTTGQSIRPVQLIDPRGDRVALYDLALDGPILLHRAADDALLTWLGGGPPISDAPADLPEVLTSGLVRLIYVESTDATGQPARPADLGARVDDLRPAWPRAGFFVDRGFELWGHLGLPAASSWILLDERMVVQAVDDWVVIRGSLGGS